MQAYKATQPTVIKQDLVTQISDQTDLTQAQVLDIVQLLLDNVTTHLSMNNEVVMRNFGTFEIRVTRPKVGRNPNAPERDIPIPARTVVKFSPGKGMKERVSQLLPKLKTAEAFPV